MALGAGALRDGRPSYRRRRTDPALHCAPAGSGAVRSILCRHSHRVSIRRSRTGLARGAACRLDGQLFLHSAFRPIHPASLGCHRHLPLADLGRSRGHFLRRLAQVAGRSERQGHSAAPAGVDHARASRTRQRGARGAERRNHRFEDPILRRTLPGRQGRRALPDDGVEDRGTRGNLRLRQQWVGRTTRIFPAGRGLGGPGCYRGKAGRAVQRERGARPDGNRHRRVAAASPVGGTATGRGPHHWGGRAGFS